MLENTSIRRARLGECHAASAGAATCTRSTAERIAPEWWRERSTVRLRDYYRIEDDTGRRYWIYRHGVIGDGRGGAPEWFIQGLFA